MASERTRSTNRPDTLSRTDSQDRRLTCRTGADHTFFRVISLRTSSSRSRSATIFFSRLFSCSSCRSRFTSDGSKRAEMLPPAVDRLRADAVLLGHLGHRLLVGLAEDRDHLLFGESRLLHGSLAGPRAPFSQASTGPKIARQVTSPRGGGVKGGEAAERSAGTLDADEHGGSIQCRWRRREIDRALHR